MNTLVIERIILIPFAILVLMGALFIDVCFGYSLPNRSRAFYT